MKSIDPALMKRIERAAAGDSPVDAVITVQDLTPGAAPLAPEETASIVDGLMRRVQAETGIAPAELRVQRNLGTFLIQAKPAFLRRLIEESCVHHAAAVEETGPPPAAIRPVRRRPVR